MAALAAHLDYRRLAIEALSVDLTVPTKLAGAVSQATLPPQMAAVVRGLRTNSPKLVGALPCHVSVFAKATHVEEDTPCSTNASAAVGVISSRHVN